ncbi:kelch-like protein 3 [Montipora capricornis]|uniref:kelch-like protein 3 n=1 Tax=Montipora capricornis TaxID=246305 RepID=UPI0035F10E27
MKFLNQRIIISQSSASIDMEEYVEAVAFEIEDLNTSASNSNMADLSQPLPSDPSKHCQELIYRLDALRRKESFFDVTVSVKNKEFKAHKLMLAAASPFFLSLLVSDMREGKEQFIRIELEEATESVMEEVLKYVYTGNVTVTKENAHDLVAAADYLLLPGLKTLACGFLEENITTENCIFNYYFADKYQCLELMGESCEFINSNFSSVMKTDDFLKLNIEQVMKWVSSDDVTVTSEEEIFKGIVKWVTHKKSERESNFAELLSQVRLKSMSHDFLFNELVNEKLVATSNVSLNFVLRSMKCTLDPFSENAAKPPRKCLGRYTDVIFVCGGRTALCYLPQKDIWYQLPDMLLEHQDHAVVQYRDKICIFGGQRVGSGESRVIEYFLSSTNCWGTVEGRHERDVCSCLSVLDGCIYGLFDFKIILYKLDESSCEAVADPPTSRCASCLVTDKRHLYLVGGIESCSYKVSKRVERFNPILATWEEVASMNGARYDAFGAAMNGKIYIAGGVNDSERHLTVLKCCEVYDPSTNEWQVMSSLKVCRQAANMVCFQEALYVVGGFKDAKSSSRELSVEVFQLGACEWKSKSTIPTNFKNENPGDQKKEIHHKACLAVIHKSLLEKLCKL